MAKRRTQFFAYRTEYVKKIKINAFAIENVLLECFLPRKSQSLVALMFSSRLLPTSVPTYLIIPENKGH